VDHVAVGVGDDLAVLGRGVDADETQRHHLEPRLLAHLAHHRLGDRLARLHAAAGQAPEAVVGAALQQEPLAGEDDRRHAGADHHGAAL